MNYIFDQFRKYQNESIDMIQDADLFYCIFSLLLKRQAEEYRNRPPHRIQRQLAREMTRIDQTRTIYEVAVLYELANWLRENHYHWVCSNEMKRSMVMYFLGIIETKPKWRKTRLWDEERTMFEITIQAEAFDKLEEQFNRHWFTLVCNQYYEIDRKHGNTAKYGCIMITKEGEGTYVR